jgi:hypothetical protein
MMRELGGTGFLAAASLSLLPAATAVSAPLIDRAYYEEKTQRTCSGAYNCRLDFTQVRPRALVEQVSCYVESSTPLRIIILGDTPSAGGLTNRSMPIPFTANYTNTSTYYYSINQPVKYLIRRLHFPIMSLETSSPSTIYASCTITGINNYPD